MFEFLQGFFSLFGVIVAVLVIAVIALAVVVWRHRKLD
jgi:Tfp pilus assembly protein PilV